MKELFITLSFLLGLAIVAEFGWLEVVGIIPRQVRSVQPLPATRFSSPHLSPIKEVEVPQEEELRTNK